MANINYITEFSFSFCTKCCTYVWENVNLNTEIHCHFTYCIAILHITFQTEFCYTYASTHHHLGLFVKMRGTAFTIGLTETLRSQLYKVHIPLRLILGGLCLINDCLTYL